MPWTGKGEQDGRTDDMNLFTRKAASVAAMTVLGITAGGIAWAESGTGTPAGPAATAAVTAPNGPGAAAAADGKAGARLRTLGRHVLHGEFVVQTRKGVVTADVARGVIVSVSDTAISVRSSDGVVTDFTVDKQTRARSQGKRVALSTLHAGDQVVVLGVKQNGASTPVARLIRHPVGTGA
jgi:hypothetical protein